MHIHSRRFHASFEGSFLVVVKSTEDCAYGPVDLVLFYSSKQSVRTLKNIWLPVLVQSRDKIDGASVHGPRNSPFFSHPHNEEKRTNFISCKTEIPTWLSGKCQHGRRIESSIIVAGSCNLMSVRIILWNIKKKRESEENKKLCSKSGPIPTKILMVVLDAQQPRYHVQLLMTMTTFIIRNIFYLHIKPFDVQKYPTRKKVKETSKFEFWKKREGIFHLYILRN